MPSLPMYANVSFWALPVLSRQIQSRSESLETIRDNFLLIFTYTYRQKAKAISCTTLSTVKSKVMSYEVIGVDEGQFVSIQIAFLF